MTNPTTEPLTRVTHPWVEEGADRIRFAIGDVFLTEWDDTVAFVRRAEQLGFDSYWAYDHPNRIMDTWTKLAAVATATERIRLISMVSCVFYRSPFLLARQAADVDRISGGRLVLGVGIGDDEPEFRELGVPFLPSRKRQQAMEEARRHPGPVDGRAVDLPRRILRHHRCRHVAGPGSAAAHPGAGGTGRRLQHVPLRGDNSPRLSKCKCPGYLTTCMRCREAGRKPGRASNASLPARVLERERARRLLRRGRPLCGLGRRSGN